MTIDVLVPYEGLPRFDRKTSPRIDAIVRLRPLLDEANSTSDETILLQTALECEKAGLKILAESYRVRAGHGKKSEFETKKELALKAIEYIQQRGKVTPVEVQHELGLSRHGWYSVASVVRKSGRVRFISNHFYVPVTEMLL
jgi:hypothetical protein